MKNSILFDSKDDYILKKQDIEFWKPRIERLLSQHDLRQSFDNIVPGFNSTYPVFVMDDVVIKFFCHRSNWQSVFQKERAVHEVLATNPDILAPKILAAGIIGEGEGSWGYKISSRIKGSSWLNTELNREQEILVFSELGSQLKKVHALPVNHALIERLDSFDHLDVKSAADKSSLPKHLLPQVNEFLKSLPPFDNVLVNSDIVLMHIFINNSHLSGIIDWGDAAITDRHYELGKLCLEFPGDKVMLKSLIEAASWPITTHFAHQALGMALYRQAVGLTQHNTFDTFHKLPGTIPHLGSVKTLEELSKILFALD